MTWPETTRRDSDGAVTLGGVSAVALAQEFGTPLYVFDEQTLRHRARWLVDTFRGAYKLSNVL